MVFPCTHILYFNCSSKNGHFFPNFLFFLNNSSVNILIPILFAIPSLNLISRHGIFPKDILSLLIARLYRVSSVSLSGSKSRRVHIFPNLHQWGIITLFFPLPIDRQKWIIMLNLCLNVYRFAILGDLKRK